MYVLVMVLYFFQESSSILLIGQRPGDHIPLLFEGLRTHGLACQRCPYSLEQKIICQSQIWDCRVDEPASWGSMRQKTLAAVWTLERDIVKHKFLHQCWIFWAHNGWCLKTSNASWPAGVGCLSAGLNKLGVPEDLLTGKAFLVLEVLALLHLYDQPENLAVKKHYPG